MKKQQRLKMQELVQEIFTLIDDWHFTICPYDETGTIYNKCNDCPCIKLCKCLLQLSDITYAIYNSNGELRK